MFGVVGGRSHRFAGSHGARVSPRLMDIAAIRIQAAGRGLLDASGRDAQYESLRKLVSSMGYYLEWFKTDLQPKCTIRHRVGARVTAGGGTGRTTCVSILSDQRAWNATTRRHGLRGFLEVSKAAVFKQKLCTNSKCRREGNGVFCAFAHDPKQLIPPLPANEVFGTRVAFEGHVLAAYCRNAGLGDPIEYEMRQRARRDGTRERGSSCAERE